MGKLVAYSGFSATNYLEMPYNSDLDFGTGDFCVMGWINKAATANNRVFERAYYTGGAYSGYSFAAQFVNSDLYFAIKDGNNNESDRVTATNVADAGWVNFAMLRRSGAIEIWTNGVLRDTLSNAVTAANLDNANAVLWVGARQFGGALTEGSLALLRISATAPTPEQIAKIYNDEKVLFQENAQATLHGASDAVTALAFDDTTQMLHVGTSAGRSVFSGLRRVSNTTTAVGTAISASGGLVVEG
jgi:hypothetical protein